MDQGQQRFLWCEKNLVKVKKENLVKASKKILCSQEKVLVLIWDSENCCVHRRQIQSNFRFHKIFIFTRESCSPTKLKAWVLIKYWWEDYKKKLEGWVFQILAVLPWIIRTNKHLKLITTKGFIILQFLQRLSSQKPFWEEARLSSLVNKGFFPVSRQTSFIQQRVFANSLLPPDRQEGPQDLRHPPRLPRGQRVTKKNDPSETLKCSKSKT